MPDFNLGEALAAAMKASKGVPVMRAGEIKLAGQAVKTAPEAVAPTVPAAAVPASSAPVARVPSVQAPSATPPPDAPQAPPINPSVQPPDVAPPSPGDAAGTPAAMPATPEVAAGNDGAPPAPVSPEAPVAPVATPPDQSVVAPANTLIGMDENRIIVRRPDGTIEIRPIPPELKQRPWTEEDQNRQFPTDPQAEAARFVAANLGEVSSRIDMTHMPNVETMSTPDGVKAAILQVADDNRGAIEEARRGVISDEQLTGMAQDLSINSDILKQVMSREFGTQMQRPEVMLAARMVEQQQMGTLLSLAGKVAGGNATSADIASFQQTSQLVQQYRTQLSGAVAEQGRGLRAMQIPVGLPNDVVDHIADVLKRNNPDMQATAEAIRMAGTPAGISNIVSGMADIPLWNRALVKAPCNMLQRIFINGILSGPPTWDKIFLGNNLNLALNTFDLYSAGIGRGMVGLAARLGGFPTASEGVTISDALAHTHGVITGAADALRVAGRVLKTGKTMDDLMRSQEDFGRNTTLSILPELQNTWFGGIAHAIDTSIDLPGRVIGSIDDFTKTLGYRGYATMMSFKEIRARIQAGTLRQGDTGQVMQDMMKNPSPEMQQAAEDWAHRMTFQTPFPEGGVGEAFTNVLNKAPALRFIFPFMRTASNIFKQSLGERTPLALFSARIRAQIANGGFEGDLAKSRIATGTAIGSMLAWMSIHDRITGDAPKDPKQRMEWELDGRTPYSVRITDPVTNKDTWHSYTWFEPLATVAGVVADSVQLHSYLNSEDDADTMLDHDAKLADARSHIMASIIQNTGNKTFMQGAAQFAEMYNDPQRAFTMWMNQVGASMVPYSGMLKFIRNEQDPFLRQAFTLMDKIRDELPTVKGSVTVGDTKYTGKVEGSKTLPARLDVFGEPRKTTSGNALLGPLNPLPDSPSTKDDVTDEIQRVSEQTRTAPITMPSQLLSLEGNGRGLQGGQGMRLNPSEYSDYVHMSRSDPVFNGGTQTFRERLEQTIASTTYQKASPAVQHDLLQNVQHAADKIGAQRLFKENPDFAERMTEWTAEKNRLKFNQ